nr:MAG TPA: hypothetical protein [Caudoviricetes sp.]
MASKRHRSPGSHSDGSQSHTRRSNHSQKPCSNTITQTSPT